MFVIDSGQPLLTAAAMRTAESTAIAAGTAAMTLMERAAAGAARAILAYAPARRATILCGPGNNGGDGYGIALLLAQAGVTVTVAADAPPAAEPAATMAQRWRAHGGAVVPLIEAPPAPLIIDALYGIGLSRPVPEAVQAALDRLRGVGRVVAIDIASGLHADTGQLLGQPLAAELTVAFGAAKPGHVLGEGASVSGRLAVIDIGVPLASSLRLTAPPRLIGPAPDAHKYSRGWVMMVEGTSGHGGAAGLSGLAALRSGAGLVTLAGEAGGRAPAMALMRRSDDEAAALLADPRMGAVVIGPGMESGPRARGWLRRLQWAGRPTVIDAGALRLLDPAILGMPAVLTPHEGEFAQLFGPVGDDRLGAVLRASAKTGAVVLLKGRATIIAAPDGRAAINAHAAPWLATAGSGDVLAGMIAALLAQGHPLFEAACAATWLHGEAGRRLGPGGIADDLIASLPAVLSSL
ncbi:NAD(P)H-hydrate dehydratase [Sandarakinorhabdus sp.]|uniref:NAD(P)H-hydrate dehydratase n=1 Tax=Sandarakinorhabdus sp. TaxID=1916663 RepID=UPI003F6EB499